MSASSLSFLLHGHSEANAPLSPILRAEDALNSGAPARALTIIDEADARGHAHGRRIYLQAARSLGQNRSIIELLREPSSIGDFVELFAALLAEKDFSEARLLLGKGPALLVDQATLDEMHNQLDLKSCFGEKR